MEKDKTNVGEEIEKGFDKEGEYVAPVENDEEPDEAVELNRRPHVQDDEEESEEPIKEKSLAEQADDEFMESISEVDYSKLTPKQREAKIASFKFDIDQAKARMEVLEPIAALADSEGFKALIEELKREHTEDIEKQDKKESSASMKDYFAAIETEHRVNKFKFAYNDRKASISAWESQIEQLKAGQLGIFDSPQAVEEKSDSIVMDNVINEEVKSFEPMATASGL